MAGRSKPIGTGRILEGQWVPKEMSKIFGLGIQERSMKKPLLQFLIDLLQ